MSGRRIAAMTAFGPTMLWLVVYISVAAVTATYGFALTASPFWQTPQKEPKGLAPSVRPLAKARRSFAPVSIWGHRPTVCFATTYMRWVRLRRTALRANPQMNTGTRSPEGAGRSRSKAKAKQMQDQKIAASLRSTAPTGKCVRLRSGRPVGRLALILTHRPLERPRGGSAQWATRHGCRVSRARPWMADRGGPTEQDRSEGMPSLGEAPNERGKSALVTLALFQSDPL
ncbi:hypothetical protein ABH904_002400 [Pseudomonas frederiksbergensis]